MLLPPPRVATLVLVDGAGAVLGALPSFEAATPWWMDVAPLVDEVRSRHGIRVVLLRCSRPNGRRRTAARSRTSRRSTRPSIRWC